MKQILKRIEVYLLYAIIFLVPLFVLPVSPNFFVVGKLALLTFGVLLLLLLKSIQIIHNGKLEFKTSKYDFPVLLIAIAYITSTILRTPNKMEALLLPGTTTAITTGALLYFAINQLSKNDKKNISKVLFSSGTVFALVSILAYTKILIKIPQLPAIVKAEFFTPEGGFLPAAIFMAVLLPIGINLVLAQKEIAKKTLLGAMLVLVIFELVISIYNLLPGKLYAARFPSYQISWSIAVDALKQSPFFGIGPGNYLTAFNRFRPLSFNNSDLWTTKFTTANTFYLTLLTETGMLGAAGLITLIVGVYRTVIIKVKDMDIKKMLSKPELLSLILLLVILLFFPTTLLSKIVLFVLLSKSSKTSKVSLNLETKEGQSSTTKRVPAIIVTTPIVLVSLYSFYQAVHIVRAEYTFTQGLKALSQGKAQETYNLITKAAAQNPKVDRYRSANSQINLALANSLAGKSDISDSDRQTIAQLVQQSINEGKVAVSLNIYRSENWMGLGKLYQSISPLTKDADAFAIQSFSQSVALDPINTETRILLGGIHYARGNFDNAVKVFELATATKPDHANAHYNLAFALREAGKLDRAIQEMTFVLSLIDSSSSDYETARQTLENMQNKKKSIEAKQDSSQGELTPPQEAEEPVLQPPLDLPEDAEPPEAPITPTPEEANENEATPSVTPQITPTPTQ